MRLMEVSDTIKKIEAIIEWRVTNLKTRHDPNILMRQLIIFDYIDIIQRHQNDKQNLWTVAFNELVAKGESAASAERLCDEAIPLANNLRRRIRSWNKVGEAIRSELSYVRTELSHLD